MPLLSLLGNKYVFGALVAASLVMWGLYERWQHHRWEERYETFKVETAAAGLAAEEKAKATAAAQEKATKEVRDQASRERNRIAAYYRLRDSGRGAVSAATQCAVGVDAATAEPAAGGSGVTVESCALDAQQVNAFQNWVRAQGIPVK